MLIPSPLPAVNAELGEGCPSIGSKQSQAQTFPISTKFILPKWRKKILAPGLVQSTLAI